MMGYTNADTLRTIHYTCSISSTLPADATTTSGVTRKVPVAHGAATQKPSFIIRGGFFGVGGSKKRLFVAGHLRKRCAQPDSKSILHKATVKQYAGVSI